MKKIHPRQRYRAFFLFTLVVGISGLWVQEGYAAKQAAKAKETPMPAASVQDNVTITFEYTLTVDGKVLDSSEGRDPMRYTHGKGQIIPGLERQMTGMHVGDAKEVTVAPEDAYGPINPKALLEVPRKDLPKDVDPKVGMVLGSADSSGRPFRATISEVTPETIKLDMNHPLAGKTLQFKIKVLSINPAVAEK